MTKQTGARPLLIVAAAALVRSDGRLLLQQRPEGKHMSGLWEFPGGKVESGEHPEGALVRELREELGLEIAEANLEPFHFVSHAYETFHLLMPVYLVRTWGGDMEAKEGQPLAWVTADEIRNYPAPPADLPIYERFIDWSKAGRA
jgi:8-oxo-dGTP diphosphatase